MDDWQTPVFLLIHAIIFSSLSVLFLVYFNPICNFFESLFPGLPGGGARFAAGFTGSVTALSAVCLFFAAGNIFYSSVSLHWDMAQRMVSVVNDWSTVKHALDVGCGRGILLNAVAMQLKKEGSSGPGKEFGHRTAAAAAERMRVLGEVVRVLKPGGVGVVWDLVHVPEYVQRLQELKMEDIRVSERVTAFMVSSHIVSFRKPRQHMVGPWEVRLEWRCYNIC
ncbi:hypothetical protein F0562_010273 [Nyssa sinensis]|uniref:Methyltransferase type 11 domain-containing protein n=1 Tax=Nyssa sinensis TaxID=561372 RepID=A0A5J5A040_9ASTE|nr:hypothetical protein F0562_010273 [Nyssa sinensis]